MQSILVSIVIATYNRPQLLIRAVNSCLAQKNNLINVEVIICDDASSNPVSKNELLNFGLKVSYFRHSVNKGPQAARNLGIEKASGDFIAILDDDDEFLPESLTKAINAIQAIPQWNKYPVFQFARTNGYISSSFEIITIEHYLTGKLKGDFAPIFNAKACKENNLKYPTEVLGISCEHFLWWEIALRWGIPSFMYNLQKLNTDADIRLTSSKDLIKKAPLYAQMEDLSVKFLEEKGLVDKYKGYYNLKLKGAATYYLLSNKTKISKNRLREIKSFSVAKYLILILNYFPLRVSTFFFKIYKSTVI